MLSFSIDLLLFYRTIVINKLRKIELLNIICIKKYISLKNCEHCHICNRSQSVNLKHTESTFNYLCLRN